MSETIYCVISKYVISETVYCVISKYVMSETIRDIAMD
jgi:predicted nucleic acid-binding protein